MKKIAALLSLCLLILPSAAQDQIKFHLEFDQMLQLRAGITWPVSSPLALRASAGFSPLGPSTWSYNLTGVYHLSEKEEPWQFDLEFGLPLGYFNFLEGRYIDWDVVIDDPFAGWLPGVTLLMGHRFNSGLWSLRLGAAAWWEHQRDSGFKGPVPMPIAAFLYSPP